MRGVDVRRTISTLLIKISDRLTNLSGWLEYVVLVNIQAEIDPLAVKLVRRAAKLYPDNFCPHCKHVLELCYHRGLIHKGKPFYSCCNCGGYIKPREAGENA